jgi:hypothetical protein
VRAGKGVGIAVVVRKIFQRVMEFKDEMSSVLRKDLHTAAPACTKIH